MIKRDGEQYARVAERIATAEDPREEILRVAQLASHAGRVRRRWIAGGSIVGALLVGVLGWQLFAGSPAGGGGETRPEAPVVDMAAEGEWVKGLFTAEAVEQPLTPEDDARLRKYIQEPTSEIEKQLGEWARGVWMATLKRDMEAGERTRLLALLYAKSNAAQTWSLSALTNKGVTVPEERLVWFLTNPEPRLTMQALTATWVHCSRTGKFSAPEAIETYVYGEDRERQKAAILALSSIKSYVPSDRLMDFLQSGDREIQQIARELLRRKGQ